MLRQTQEKKQNLPAALMMTSESIKTIIQNHHIMIWDPVPYQETFFPPAFDLWNLWFLPCSRSLCPRQQDTIVMEISVSTEIIKNSPSKINTWHVMHHLQLIKPCGAPFHHLPLRSWLQQGMVVLWVAQELPTENHCHFPTCIAFPYLLRTKKSLFSLLSDWKNCGTRNY